MGRTLILTRIAKPSLTEERATSFKMLGTRGHGAETLAASAIAEPVTVPAAHQAGGDHSALAFLVFHCCSITARKFGN